MLFCVIRWATRTQLGSSFPFQVCRSLLLFNAINLPVLIDWSNRPDKKWTQKCHQILFVMLKTIFMIVPIKRLVGFEDYLVLKIFRCGSINFRAAPGKPFPSGEFEMPFTTLKVFSWFILQCWSLRMTCPSINKRRFAAPLPSTWRSLASCRSAEEEVEEEEFISHKSQVSHFLTTRHRFGSVVKLIECVLHRGWWW